MSINNLFTCFLILGFSFACDDLPPQEDSQHQKGVVNANGIDIAYESFGDPEDETVLMIHGIGSQLIEWPREFCESLAERGYRVIIFDNRDVGLSTRLDSRRTGLG